jgi:methylated-DNA-protein-cysteine methyltransferase related protein
MARQRMTKPSKHGTGTTFSERVVAAARSIPSGKVSTYGRLARAAGAGGMAAQSITTILSKAYDSGIKDIPFHRIVYADGRIWVNDEYRTKRMALYKKEKIKIGKDDRIENFADKIFEFR